MLINGLVRPSSGAEFGTAGVSAPGGRKGKEMKKMTSAQIKEMMDRWPKKLESQREIIQIISRKTSQPIKLIIYSQPVDDYRYPAWFYSFNWGGNVFGSSKYCYYREQVIEEAWEHIDRLEQPHTFLEFLEQISNVVRSFRQSTLKNLRLPLTTNETKSGCQRLRRG